MPADHATGCLIPDNRLHIAKLLDGAFQFFVFRITGLQILTRVIIRRDELGNFLFLYQHISPHSANFSKPPTRSMKALAVL